jgi:hypothetical protein
MAKKLHELLAVEGSLETQAMKCLADLTNTFEKKRHLFEEKRTVFVSNEENKPPVTETQSDLQTTVAKEIEWLTPMLSKMLDASYQVSEANTVARADVIDEAGKTILGGVPATSLLELEKRLQTLHGFLTSIPTLDPAKGFKADEQRGAGVYQAREVTKTRTKKVQKPVVLYEATKEHPAQVQLAGEDVPVGSIHEKEWSGLMTPADKSKLLARCESLTRAVRQARSKANEAPVDPAKKIGDSLLSYIFQ